jgi:hypothetical protein
MTIMIILLSRPRSHEPHTCVLVCGQVGDVVRVLGGEAAGQRARVEQVNDTAR